MPQSQLNHLSDAAPEDETAQSCWQSFITHTPGCIPFNILKRFTVIVLIHHQPQMDQYVLFLWDTVLTVTVELSP